MVQEQSKSTKSLHAFVHGPLENKFSINVTMYSRRFKTALVVGLAFLSSFSIPAFA